MTFTAILIILTITVLIIIDIFLATDGRKDNTISEVIALWGSRAPVLPYGFGFLMGHFFWHRPGAVFALTEAQGALTATLIALILTVIGIWVRETGRSIHGLIPLLIGILCGHLFWPQFGPGV